MHTRGFRFDDEVASDGYAWWYVDALSDDGRHGLTAIAFIGSVFSPYYAAARRRERSARGDAGVVSPLDHCALNVALYGARGGRWAMTERGCHQVERNAVDLAIGPSALHWRGDFLEMQIDERCAPVPRRLRGTIRVFPERMHERSFALDAAGEHEWTPYAPRARVEVRMRHPDSSWSGHGYFDHNRGAAPLEDSFAEWTWSRASLADRTAVFYDTWSRSGSLRTLALQFGPSDEPQPIDAPPAQPLPRTRWGLTRHTRSERAARVVRPLEDAPFYSRSELDVQVMGTRARAIQETLALRRFRSRWVQCLLPFRMPRIARGSVRRE